MLPIEQVVREVEEFDCAGRPALSLYLDTVPPEAGGSLVTQMTSLLSPLRASLNGDHVAADHLGRSTELVLARLEALQPSRALAAFACPDAGFVRVVPLPEVVGQSAHFGPELYLARLLAELDEHERTVVVLLDRARARVFRVFLGQIEEMAHLERDGRQHRESGSSHQKSLGASGSIRSGYGERNLERRDQWHVRQHLERTLAAMRPGSDRVLLGGALESVLELVRLLPKRVRDRTRLISGLSVDASLGAVLERVLEAQREAEREEEEELVDNLNERDRARTVFGAAAVAEAVSDDRVHTLVYSSGTAFGGSECGACGWLSPGLAEGACGRCGGVLQPRPEMIECLVARVRHAGGRVEEVRGPAQKALLRREGLAALLRWVPRATSAMPEHAAGSPARGT